MTDSPSEAEVNEAEEGSADSAPENGEAFAAAMGELVGSTASSSQHGIARIEVGRQDWVASAIKVRDAGLDFFSWLSAVDWSREVAVGDQVEEPETLVERFEVICRLSSVSNADAVHLVTYLDKDDASLPTLTTEFGGAEWHEREAAEMFGIEFVGNASGNRHLYLPDSFEGHPLLKSYPLLSREVKPWPGTVDVEDMPTTENPEAEAAVAAEDDA